MLLGVNLRKAFLCGTILGLIRVLQIIREYWCSGIYFFLTYDLPSSLFYSNLHRLVGSRYFVSVKYSLKDAAIEF